MSKYKPVYKAEFEVEPAEILSAATESRLSSRPVGKARPKERLRLRLYGLLILVDTFAMAAAFALAGAIRFGSPQHSESVETFALLWPIYICIALNGRAYSIDALENPRLGASRAIHALIFAIAAAVAMLFSLKVSSDFSRLVFGIGAVSALIMVTAGRVAAGKLIGERFAWTFRNELLFVDGTNALPTSGEEVVFADREGLRPSLDDPEMLDRIGRLLEYRDRVILACPPARRRAWAQMLKGANVDVEILAPELDQLGALALRQHGGRSTFLVGCGPLGLRDRVLKRLLDLAVSLTAVIALSPIMLAIAIAVRLESKGPILFRQARVGRGNRIFSMLKFRSMRAASADLSGTRSAARDDDRVTRVGRFIRSTSLDELPQFLNVVKGEMSVVGPRPHALASTAEDRLFWAIDARYWDRHAIKPGLTGLAQIRGFRGATATCSDLTNRLQSDLEYLANWTVGRDIAIIVRTLKVMVHRNAY